MIRIRRKKKDEQESQNRDRWLISYADLVTLLLALFIVMYAASDKQRAQQIAKSFAAQNSGDGILPEHSSLANERAKFDKKILENPVLAQKTKMRQTERGFIVSLSEAGFFAPGEAVISAEAETVISALAETLRASSAQIRVEGHTDSMPISNARYPSNWELSTARASSVLIRLTERGITPERLSAAGYGGFQPVADNSSPEGRALNRRVDVVILNH
jgi:chemotaxis protein MotB